MCDIFGKNLLLDRKNSGKYNKNEYMDHNSYLAIYDKRFNPCCYDIYLIALVLSIFILDL